MSNLPEGWIETTLGEIAEINPRESIKKGSLAKSVPMDKLASFDKRITGFDTKEFKGGCKFRNGDTLLARITPCLENGKTAYVDILDDGEIGFGSTEYIVIREKEGLSNKQFLFYLATSPRFREIAIKCMTGTSGRQRVQTDVLVNKLFKLPLLPEQKAIADMLSSFDEKIELLREQNKTLETLAQTIFKEWFVNFNYPAPQPPEGGDGGKSPSGDLGAEMVDSELGQIPKGWRVGRLSDFGKIVCGKTPSKSKAEYFGGDVPFIKIPDMHNNMFIVETTDTLTQEGKASQALKTIPKNSISISCIATVGLVSISIKESQTNQQINTIVPKEEYLREFIFLGMQKRKKYLMDIGSGGTATLNVNTGVFSKIESVMPTDDVLELFSTTVVPLFDKILENCLQHQALSKTRDALLPKLMSGKVRVES
ncbi:MAG: hypothetical protein AUK35_06365 [Zetaproteobacteria bacterium CG2_30_46_52]|nr:MAG: hypothetical protein AUK35_06365 [Zetaproteobacteria bacterium CG2_30_46_52]